MLIKLQSACCCAARGAPTMVAVLRDPHAALVTRSLAAGALRHFMLSEVLSGPPAELS